MGYTFTFGDIERICRSLSMRPAKPGSRLWQGLTKDGSFRQTLIHSHGSGKSIATGTAKRIAQQLGFKDLKEMHDYLADL